MKVFTFPSKHTNLDLMPGYIKRIVLISALIFSFSIRNVIASNIPGVQTPIPIDPRVDIANDRYLFYVYRVILDRDPDDGGMRDYLPMLESGTDRKYLFSLFFNSAEFRNNSILTDKNEYVKRLYLSLLKHPADPGGLAAHAGALPNVSDLGALDSWYDRFNIFLYSTEYKVKNCQTGYYSYQQPLHSDTPILADLFDGKAHFQPVNEARAVDLQFNPSHVTSYWDNKIPIVFNSEDGNYYTFTRGIDKSINRWNMYILKSNDGLNFTEVGPMFDSSVIQSSGDMIDGQIAIDYSVCPAQYVMAMECSGSMCASSSTVPFKPYSWSKPVSVVGYDLAHYKSASTGVFLIDGNNKYAAWTVVDDVNALPGDPNKTHDAGMESAYSRAISASNLLSNLGSSGIGSVILPPDLDNKKNPPAPDTHCTSSWDCDNRDKQDWKKEGNYYYLMYNGANYFRCSRLAGDSGTNFWGLGIVRSTDPLSGYDLAGVGEIITAQRQNCGTSYPTINQINGDLYMYYAYVKNGVNQTLGSKLVWNSPTPTLTPIPPTSTPIPPSPTLIPPTPTSTPTPIPGDITGPLVFGVPDGKVDIYDYNLLITDFGLSTQAGKPGSPADIDANGIVNIFDYNTLIGNFGRYN